jgi:hypothetical protein
MTRLDTRKPLFSDFPVMGKTKGLFIYPGRLTPVTVLGYMLYETHLH